MKLPRRTFLSLAGALALAPAISRAASALDYPTRPITIIVPFPAGGPVDTLARLLAEPMRIALGQPLVIENVGGAGGSIAAARVARAELDGYNLTTLGTWTSLAGIAGGLSGVVRREERFRTGCALLAFSAFHAGLKSPAANDVQELTLGLGKANFGQGDVRHHRHRQPEPGRRR